MDVIPVKTSFVRGYTEAELLARASAVSVKRDPDSVKVTEIAWETSVDASGDIARATVRFDLQRQYIVRISQRLRGVELSILSNPSDGGNRNLYLGRSPSESQPIQLDLPPALNDARRELFQAILRRPISDNGEPVVALIDLCSMADSIRRYAHEYKGWVQSGSREALLSDVTRVQLQEGGTVALVSPTHPLRLLWLLQEQQVARSWMRSAAR